MSLSFLNNSYFQISFADFFLTLPKIHLTRTGKWEKVGNLVVACCWSAVYSTEP